MGSVNSAGIYEYDESDSGPLHVVLNEQSTALTTLFGDNLVTGLLADEDFIAGVTNEVAEELYGDASESADLAATSATAAAASAATASTKASEASTSATNAASSASSASTSASSASTSASTATTKAGEASTSATNAASSASSAGTSATNAASSATSASTSASTATTKAGEASTSATNAAASATAADTSADDAAASAIAAAASVDEAGRWDAGSGAPSGDPGDGNWFYLDTTNGDVYNWGGASWGSPIANLTGPQGIQGAMGASLTPVGIWSILTTYAQGEVVTYDDSLYASLTDTNLAQQPDTAPTFWVSLNGSVPAWGDIVGTIGAQTDLQDALDLKADAASPALSGVPTAPTASPSTNNTQIATTAYVTHQGDLKANLGGGNTFTQTQIFSNDVETHSGFTATGAVNLTGATILWIPGGTGTNDAVRYGQLDTYLAGSAPSYAALGSELFTNGAFTGNATGWTLAGSAAYGTNNVNMPNGGSVAQSVSLTSSDVCRVTFGIGTAGDTWTVTVGTVVVAAVIGATGVGANVVDFAATATASTAIKVTRISGTSTVTIDDVSLKKFTANAAPKSLNAGVVQRISANSSTYLGDLGFPVIQAAAANNNGFGVGTLKSLTGGAYNNAFGNEALAKVTSAAYNNAFGNAALASLQNGYGGNQAFGLSALTSLVNGSSNVAMGQQTLASTVSGSGLVAVGDKAFTALTTGDGDVALGYLAGYYPVANSAFATTTASYQTLIGSYTGQGSATARDGITVLGYSAAADTANGIAIGRLASVGAHVLSTAIGYNTATTAPNQFKIAPSTHIEMTEMTAPSAGAADSARLFVRDNGSGKTQLCVIYSSGAIQVISTQP